MFISIIIQDKAIKVDNNNRFSNLYLSPIQPKTYAPSGLNIKVAQKVKAERRAAALASYVGKNNALILLNGRTTLNHNTQEK
ncbi:hypothetical protein [Rickettsia rickettsii]|uniref:Uncharacterized protein n=1 Tax=Rickettsia rickettsii (strain Sheila Smith) TaxID=392021 RepID=A0A0H3AZ73_RICRS|nr:hypothetical protein [Rickettsia rickettsii]ABV76681.1 hypothetical protein A1G_06105 [Rickettsia rickettsii str. 'Sheila Smith']AFB21755.1 hypothetical protein RPN_00890 [Rickettsia rickettsii str. Brazil]USD86536.1 hypothetical protein NDY48_05720 [Rickettsia rickettsii]USD87849.1 hypothetical protein NDY49_05765 [Rickettsia rickettsii]WGQ95269.1 hypothetical protein QBX69_05805 [Rickettsia rickettsii str. 'Sheila Smith']